MTMIGPAVRAGVFEHQTDDLERVLGHSSGARGRIPTSAPRLQRGLAL